MKLTEILTEELIIPHLRGGDKSKALEEMANLLCEKKLAPDGGQVLKALLEREKLGSTGIGFNVAIPHAKVKDIQNMAVVFGRSPKGIEFDSLDQQPVHLICLLIAPENSIGAHIKALARISRLLKEEHFRKELMRASDQTELFGLIRSKDDELN